MKEKEDIMSEKEKYYSQVAFIDSMTDGELHDLEGLYAKSDYKQMLALAKEYDQGDSIEQRDTFKDSPMQYKGDDIVDEDDNYALLRNYVTGSYSVFRKVDEQTVRDSIERYGLDKDASEDVRAVAEKMEQEKAAKVSNTDTERELNPQEPIPADTRNTGKFIDVSDKEKDYGYNYSQGHWHTSAVNELRVYQRYGEIMKDWNRSAAAPTISRENYVQSLPDGRKLSPTEMLVLSMNNSTNDYHSISYMSAKDIQDKNLKVREDAKPVPLYDFHSGSVMDYYNLDDTNLRLVNPQEYERQSSGARAQADILDPSIADAKWLNDIQIFADDEWHCKVTQGRIPDDVSKGYAVNGNVVDDYKPLVFYDPQKDTVVISEDVSRDDEMRNDYFKYDMLTALKDSLVESGRIKGDMRTQDAARTMSGLMDAIQYDLRLSGKAPKSNPLGDYSNDKWLDDPMAVRKTLDYSAMMSDSITERGTYVATGVRDGLTEELLKTGQSKPATNDGVFAGNAEEEAKALSSAPEKQDDKDECRSPIHI